MSQVGYAKQLKVQVLPPKEQLQAQCQQLWEIAANLELPLEGEQIVNHPRTEIQRGLQRRAKRIVNAKRRILEAAEILRSLSS